MNNSKILIGSGVVLAIAILAYFLIIKPSQDDDKGGGGGSGSGDGGEGDDEEPYIHVPDDVLPPPTDDPPTGDDDPPPVHERREVDPNSEEGRNLIKYQMEEYYNNDSALYQIKKQNEVGKRMFDGISPNKRMLFWNDRSPESSIEGFLNEIAGGKFKREDYGTYPIFSELQKPGLYAEMDRLASEEWATANQAQAARKDFQGYNLHTLGGANITSHFGDLHRKHDLYFLRQAKTAAGNYRTAMVKLDQAVKNAAIRALATQKNIWFIGINTATNGGKGDKFRG